MSELPPGWIQTPVEDLAEEVKGSIAPNSGEQYELYSVPAYPTGAPEMVVGAVIGSNKRPVAPNDVLLCKINPRINRVWYVGPHTKFRQLASTEFIPLRLPLSNAVTARYLMWYLRSPVFREWIKLNAEGATGSHTRAKSAGILRQLVPLAPFAEQERIVAAIEEQFSRLDAGAAALESARRKVNRMRAAVLREAIEGRLVAHDPAEPAVSGPLPVDVIAGEAFPEQPRNWTTTTIAGIASVTSGATPSRRRSDYWTGGSIPWVTSTMLNAKTVQRANEFVTPRALADTSIKLMLPGTLLVAMYGEGQTRGRCSELLIEATTNQACAAIVVRNELAQIQPYIKMFLIASYEANRRLSVGGVQPNLSVGTIKDIRIALPPMREQARILSEADRQLASLDQLEDALVQQEHRTRRLRSSILADAFSGDLVPQDPGEEPAADLLNRIAAGRAVFNSSAMAPGRRPRTPPEKITA
jgi:type I restriction enzyme S subunit